MDFSIPSFEAQCFAATVDLYADVMEEAKRQEMKKTAET